VVLAEMTARTPGTASSVLSNLHAPPVSMPLALARLSRLYGLTVRHDRQTSGILAFLADRFNVRSREELAAEALSYLLQEYPAVRDAVIVALSTTLIAPDIRNSIAFISQARSANDPWVGDVEGRVNEHVYISIEVKLDASLQPSQPVDYVKRLDAGGSLLFVCPSRRIARLSAELRRRAAREGLLMKNAVWTQDAADISWIPLIADKQLGITPGSAFSG
jgi:hypothetical protein